MLSKNSVEIVKRRTDAQYNELPIIGIDYLSATGDVMNNDSNDDDDDSEDDDDKDDDDDD